MALALSDHSSTVTITPPPSRRRRFVVSKIGRIGGISLIATYLSIIVVIPVTALVLHGIGFGISTNGAGPALWRWSWHLSPMVFIHALQLPGAVHAIVLSLWLSLLVAFINCVMGLAIAWVLVRDEFPGKRILDGFIDLPFALPTIVAGVVFVFLYGPASPLHVDLFETWIGLMVALLFVTIPFSVRAVQPVLEHLDRADEEAALTLGAGPVRRYLTVVLPSLAPAALAGFGLAFARAIGEFGSIALISGGVARTTPGSAYVFMLTGSFQWAQAAAVSTALLLLSLVVLITSSVASRRISKRLGS